MKIWRFEDLKMDTPKDEMKLALNQIVIPELRKLQFKGTFPHFRRILDGKLNLLTFQFDKYGGGFIIEIANCDANGFTTHWGKEIPPTKLTVYDLSKRKRIYADIKSADTSINNWYRYDRTSLNQIINIYQSICNEILDNLNFAENYWRDGEVN